MKQWLKDQLPTLIVGALVVVVLFLLFKKKEDAGADVKAQMDQLKTEMKGVILHEFDSLRNQIAVPITDNNAHADSLADIEHAENNKILYAIKKKNEARIDTVSSVELRSIFSEYARQHPVRDPAN